MGKSRSILSDEKIFAGPLGQDSEEGHNTASPGATASAAAEDRASTLAKEETPMSTSFDRDRDRRSLQDLAKLAQLTPAPASVRTPAVVARAEGAKDEDSGLVNLAAFASGSSTDMVAGPATPAPGLAGLFDDEGPASMPPPSVAPVSSAAHVQAPVSVSPMMVAPAAAPSVPPPSMRVSVPPVATESVAPSFAAQPVVAAPERKKGGAGIVIALGAVFALSAVAAGGFMFVRASKTAPVAAQTVKAPEPVVAAAEPKPAAKPEAEAVATPEPQPSVDPNALGTPVAAAPKGVAGKAAPVAAVAAAAPANKAEPKAAEEPKTAAPQLAAKDLPQGGAAGSLGEAMQKAAGGGTMKDESQGSSGPDFAPGSRPQRPSQGALTGAIGAALPGARACVGPDDPVSRATIVFGSAGNAQSVTVSGFAAGKPAEGCIKAALMKAKVAPFAEATYSTGVTIRH
jgi:hypothetical protein